MEGIGRGIAAIREKTQISDTLYIYISSIRTLFPLSPLRHWRGFTFQNISTVHLKIIPSPSPTPEQCAIAICLGSNRQRTAALEREVKHLDELFHAMLEELMTGKRSAMPLIDSGIAKLTEEAT